MIVDILLARLLKKGYKGVMRIGAKEENKEVERVVAVKYKDIERVNGQYKILILDDSMQLKESYCFSLLHKFKCDKLLLSGDSRHALIGQDYFKNKAECSLFSRLHECKGCGVNLHTQFRVSCCVIVVSSRNSKIRK